MDDDGEEEEKTVKWDAPSEWPGAARRAPAAILPSVVPHPLGGAPKSVSAATPGVASARQGTLTQRISRASLQPVAIHTIEPAAYLDSPYIASVASALAVPSTTLAPEAPRGESRRFVTAEKTWLAVAAFAAGVAVTWFTYNPGRGGDAQDATAAEGDGNIRTLSVEDLPQVQGGESDDEDLPVIVTSQLPRATDEAGEPRRPALGLPLANQRRISPALTAPAEATPARATQGQADTHQQRGVTQKVQALAPAQAVAPAKSGSTHSKAVDAGANCTPPYYFDKRGIQRVKSECLNATRVITGPYGAAITTTVSAKTVAPTPSKPTVSDKQARASSGCTPPYYFDGKIRRIKSECL